MTKDAETTKAERKARRLAEALRSNLRRRKLQARGRAEAEPGAAEPVRGNRPADKQER
jgi:hypothetical protein